MEATPSNLAHFSLGMIQEIKADMAAGTVPATVKDFSQLHDYVDANEYLINALAAAGWDHDPASEAQAAFLNRAMSMVNVWLAAKRG